MEARPTLYKRPTLFTSQAKLFAWIDRSRKQDLKRVRTLTLRVTDVDLSSLLDQSNPPQKARAGVWSLYQFELDRLDEALQALTHLTSLTVVPPTLSGSQLLKGLYHSFLALIPRRCSKLRRLEVEDSVDILVAVPALKDVAALSCTGKCSSRRPAERSEDSPAGIRDDASGTISDTATDARESKSADTGVQAELKHESHEVQGDDAR